MPRSTSQSESSLELLRAAAQELLPLPALSGEDYARGHALFEARSDQRELLTDWLWTRLEPRAGRPLRLLSVGCGDGTVDAELARRLRDRGGEVVYDGVEPFAGSAAAWTARLAGVKGVRSTLQQVRFEAYEPATGPYDVVVFVHSLYYVADVGAALRQAVGLLAPGGELVVLHAPRAELNALVEVLAPSTDGHRQWFSDTVTGVLRRQGWPHTTERLRAELDLSGAGDVVLDFTVQAALPAALRPLVVEHLEHVALRDLVVPHPLDAFTVISPKTGTGLLPG